MVKREGAAPRYRTGRRSQAPPAPASAKRRFRRRPPGGETPEPIHAPVPGRRRTGRTAISRNREAPSASELAMTITTRSMASRTWASARAKTCSAAAMSPSAAAASARSRWPHGTANCAGFGPDASQSAQMEIAMDTTATCPGGGAGGQTKACAAQINRHQDHQYASDRATYRLVADDRTCSQNPGTPRGGPSPPSPITSAPAP